MAVQAPLFDHLYDSAEDHKDIVAAIAAEDPGAAKDCIEQHILRAGRLVVQQMEQAGGSEQA
jgi:DNA-binding GntR family transcriptional regulator